MTATLRIDGAERDADRTADGLLLTSCPRCGQRIVQVRVEGLPVLVDLERIGGLTHGDGPFIAVNEQGRARRTMSGVRGGGEGLHTPHRATCPNATGQIEPVAA